jgi:hypothetical protein
MLYIASAALWLLLVLDRGGPLIRVGWAAWTHLAVSVLLTLVSVQFLVKASQATDVTPRQGPETTPGQPNAAFVYQL